MAAERFYKKHKSFILQLAATAGIASGGTWLIDKTLINNQQHQPVTEAPVSTQKANIVPEKPTFQPVNLIENGDFERVVSLELILNEKTENKIVPISWEITSEVSPDYLTYFGIEDTEIGSKALYLEIFKSREGQQSSPIIISNQINIDSDSNYRFSFRGKSQIKNSPDPFTLTLAPGIQIEYTDEFNSKIKVEELFAVPAVANKWQYFELILGPDTKYQIPQNAKSLKIGLLGGYKSPNHLGDRIYFDDVEFNPQADPLLPRKPQT